ncbi:MAG: hypothetical protein ACRD3V_30925 [Vicinamibacteria bacterium]
MDTESDSASERPLGVYFVALYFVLSGFLESIRKYQESDQVWSMNPLADHSFWTLTVDPIVYLGLAYLIWRFASIGRLAALVYGYVILAMYAGIAASYFVFETPLNVTPLFVALSAFHVLALPALLWYLQPARQKKLFHVSLWEILLSSD